jgi:tetratricopeptide (TPR) repeat protein
MFLASTGCESTPNDPVGTTTKYIRLGERTTTAGVQKRYNLLSEASRQTASLNEYVECFKPKPKGNDTCYVTDSISVLTSDTTLVTYRRVRAVLHDRNDSLGTPVVEYYTLANDRGKWRIVWEGKLLCQVQDLFSKGMHEEAIALCDKALELNPYSAQAYSQKAWCYDRKNSSTWDEVVSRSTRIEANARKALALEPERPDFYNTLSLAYTVPELKIECYQKALALRYCTKKRRTVYYGNIANSYLNDKKPAKSIPYSDSALLIDSTKTYTLVMRGEAENMLGRYAQAKMFYDRALNTNWQDWKEGGLDQGVQQWLFYGAAFCEFGLKDYDAALEHVLKALEIDPAFEMAQELYKSIKSEMQER